MKKLLFTALLLLMGQAFAEDFPRAVITLYGDKEEIDFVKIQPGEGMDYHYYDKAIKNKVIFRSVEEPEKKWQEMQFSFRASKAGKVRLKITGRHHEKSGKVNWIEYDDLKISGSDIVNGDFEQLKNSGVSEGWWKFNSNQLIKGDAANGEHYIIAGGNSKWVQQWIEVKEGTKVTISFKCRAPKKENIKKAELEASI
ncbi:hypothetical protein PQO01_17175 [Lentisphaera marina]|uniref:hypothetical protein n=1 Tax=Lentisphaera marina TaxID=1111041 RepID=UPI0023662161|nr:hypothetical protein [Lentisphaera marina]MDD7986683.1 hypothetical protein [Lentisphaera marina]